MTQAHKPAGFWRRLRAQLKADSGYHDLVQQHAPDLVRTAYQALLNREPDANGLQHYIDYLRGAGRLDALLRELSGSQEFLQAVDARRREHLDNYSSSLPHAAPKLAVFANCQGGNLSRCIQVLTGAQAPAFTFVGNDDVADPTRLLPALRTALDDNDLLLLQPAHHAALSAHGGLPMERLRLVPAISFAAFQPDFCGVQIKGTLEEIHGPMGRYQSSIAYYAWRAGMSPTQTLDLFCAPVYEALRFFDYWDSSAQVLLKEGASCGIALEHLLHGWRARGCFMHSPNHPKLFVMADLTRAILQKLGIDTLPLRPEELVWDQLADLPLCPVYPQIAERLGVAGSTRFKGDSQSLDGKAPIVSFDLESFIAQSFAAFTANSTRFELECMRPFSPRYQEVFGSTRSWHRAVPPAARSVPLHPYAALPARQFWKSGVAGIALGEVDPADAALLRIGQHTRIASAGSCFAQHIAQRLRQRGLQPLVTEPAPAGMSAEDAARRHYGVYAARFGEIYTARQLRQLLERAMGRCTPVEAPWILPNGRLADPFRPDIEPDGFADVQALEAARSEHLQAVRQMFEAVEVFVFTLGLTEAWIARADGAVFPLAPGVVAGTMDAQRHAFVNFSVAEVIADLDAFVSQLRALNPQVKLLFTVSPVGLAATYEDRHVLAATSYSKSVLRVAAETICRTQAGCQYFPAYEIITGAFNRGAYFDPGLRAVNAAGVDHVMRLFFAHYAPDAVASGLDAELLGEAKRNYQVRCAEERLADAASP